MEPKKTLKRHSIRTDFVLLLHLSIIGMFITIWFLFTFFMVVSGEGILDYLGEYLFASLIILIVGCFLSIFSVSLSNVLKQIWWIAVPATLLLLGTPVIGLIITWIGKQIARLFYLATESDLERTKLILDMTVKPRKGILYAEPVQSGNKEAVNDLNTPEEIVRKSRKKTAELKVKNEKPADKQAEPVLPKFFSLWQCVMASLLGGVLAGGMLLALNYKALQERRNFLIGIGIGLVGQFILLIMIVGVSYSDSSLLTMIPIVLGIAISVYFWYRELQQREINQAILSKKAAWRSWWMVVGFVVLSWLFIALFNSLAEEIVWSLDLPF